MAMGECGELIAAINRFFTQNRGDLNELVEEIADVEIMMAQLREIVGHNPVDEAKALKLIRLENTLDTIAERSKKVRGQ